MHGIRGKVDLSRPGDSTKLNESLFEYRRIPEGYEYSCLIPQYQTSHQNSACCPVHEMYLQPIVGQGFNCGHSPGGGENYSSG